MPIVMTAPAALASSEIPVDFTALPAVSGDVRLLLNEFLALLARDIQQQSLPMGKRSGAHPTRKTIPHRSWSGYGRLACPTERRVNTRARSVRAWTNGSGA